VVCFIFSGFFPNSFHAREALFYRILRFNKLLPQNKNDIFLHCHVKRIVTMNIPYVVARSIVVGLR